MTSIHYYAMIYYPQVILLRDADTKFTYLKLSYDREIKELEWYLRDHFFRQSNKGITQFERRSLTYDLITVYLRYRNYTLERMGEMMNPVLKNLISRQVIARKDNNDRINNFNSNNKLASFELTSPLSRLQCSTCFYISYICAAEPKNCLRCSSTNLHDFQQPSKKRDKQ